MTRNTDHETTRRRQAFRLGIRAESLAALYLRLKGYRILDRRYRSRAGEIDIVAKRGDDLCFVEVKARRTLQAAIEAVTPRAQRRIVTAARIWLSSHPGHERVTWRFDIIAIVPRSLPRHVLSAFEAGS